MAGRIKWVVPTAGDVTALMSSIVQTSVTKDPNGQSRSASCLALVVEQVQGAVRTGNRVPLSLTNGSVPPSGHIHTVVLAVSLMVSSTPNMTFAVKDEFGNQVKDAKDWLERVRKGEQAVDYPTDPDQSTLPFGGGLGYGGEMSVDMSTDGSQQTYYKPPSVGQALPPENLQATAGEGSVDLEWRAPNNPASIPVRYSVYRGTASGTYDPTPIVTGLAQTSFTDTDVQGDTAYFYVVRATNSSGDSPNSNEATATPDA